MPEPDPSPHDLDADDDAARRSATRDPTRLLAALQRDRVSLELRTLDLCFLVALRIRSAREGLACFEEPELLDVFEQVCDLVEPGADNTRKRATHAIQRLRDQRLLRRVDGAGILGPGEYSLTRLATGIIDFLLEDEALTRESLTLLTKALLVNLGDVASAARKATSAEDWRTRVIGPLQVTVADLVSGIERRQRGLDDQQDDVKLRIGELLQRDWFESVDRCESLLEVTATTLAELNEVLLHDAAQMTSVLDEIERAAAAADAAAAEEAAQRVSEQIDRVAAWGRTRQRAWSDYYQYIHGYLRDVVRLDPERALSERLRDGLARFLDRPFALLAARAPAIRVPRDVTGAVLRSPVVRPPRERERPLVEEDRDDAARSVEDLVADALAASPSTLSAVLRTVLPHLPPAGRYLATGRATEAVAPLAADTRDRRWVRIDGALEIEDWTLAPAPPPAGSDAAAPSSNAAAAARPRGAP